MKAESFDVRSRCETPLAKAEVAMDNSYKTVTEEALTIKLKLKL